MTFNKSFLLHMFLIASGFLLCTSLLANKEESVMGIHLGATYSSVGVYKHPRLVTEILSLSDIIEIVENEQGSKTMPSCVSFTDLWGVLIGEPAKAQETVNPERTVCGITRLIGKRFDDAEVQRYIKGLTYKVVNQENKPYVEVKLQNGETKLYSPEEILAMILGRLKAMAEKYMGNEVQLTFILVQTGYLDDEVKRHIREACKMAGLNKVFLARSANANILARDYAHTRENFRVLVYDLGGSAFSATIQEHYDIDFYESVASKEDAHLGGQTFDTRLVDYFVNVIKNKYKEDISNDLTALVMLRTECENAKIALSSSERVTIKVDIPLANDESLHFEEVLTREMFEELNMDLFNKTVDLVKDAMTEAKLEKLDIHEIILVGGSIQIPMIQRLLKSFFGREPLNFGNPNEALAFAATRLAGLLIRDDSDILGVSDRTMDEELSPIIRPSPEVSAHFFGSDNLDVHSMRLLVSDLIVQVKHVQNTLSVGVETTGGLMAPFVGIDAHLPAMKSRNVVTYHDRQTTVEIKVFEGDTMSTKYSHYLGSLQLSDIPPAPSGVTKIEVTVEVFKDWNIRVTAEHKETRKKKSMTIPYKERYNTMEELRQAYSKIHKCYEEDKTLKDIIGKLQLQRSYNLDKTLRGIISMLQPQSDNMTVAIVNKIYWRKHLESYT